MAEEKTNRPVDFELLKEVLDVVRPSLQADGGDCELIGVDGEGVVTLRLTGACSGCPLSSVTLGMGIERILKEHVPGVTRVVAEEPDFSMDYSAFGSVTNDDEDDIPTLL